MLKTVIASLTMFLVVTVLLVPMFICCGGTHGRIARVWVDISKDSLSTLLLADSTLPIALQRTSVVANESVYMDLATSTVSSTIDTLTIHVTIDMVKNGRAGCYLGLIAFRPAGSSRYCFDDDCSDELEQAAIKLFEELVIEPVNRHVATYKLHRTE